MPSASPISQWGLGLEIEFLQLAPGFDGFVVGFGDADGDFVAREIGDAGERLTQLLVELGGGLVELVEFVFEGAGFFHDGGGFVVLAGFFESAHLLAELVAAGLALLGESDGLAAALIEDAKIAQKSGGVGAARAQFFFN